MLSVKKVKELLNDETISDEEATKIRDDCRELVEIIFETQKKNEDNKDRAPASKVLIFSF